MGFFDFIGKLFAEDKVMLTIVTANGVEKGIEVHDDKQAVDIVGHYVKRAEEFELHFIDSHKNELSVTYDPEKHDDFIIVHVQGGDYNTTRCEFVDHNSPVLLTLAVTAFMEGNVRMDFIFREKD